MSGGSLERSAPPRSPATSTAPRSPRSRGASARGRRGSAPVAPIGRTARLSGPIDRALEGAPDHKPRADLAHVVVEDRLAALIAQFGRHFAQTQRLDARVGPKLLADPLLKRIELRHPGGRLYLGGASAANARRIVLRCSPVRLLISRIDSRSTHAPDLRPLLHADHTVLLSRSFRSSESPAGIPTPRQVGHFSTGAGGPLFTRRPHPASVGMRWRAERVAVPAAGRREHEHRSPPDSMALRCEIAAAAA